MVLLESTSRKSKACCRSLRRFFSEVPRDCEDYDDSPFTLPSTFPALSDCRGGDVTLGTFGQSRSYGVDLSKDLWISTDTLSSFILSMLATFFD